MTVCCAHPKKWYGGIEDKEKATLWWESNVMFLSRAPWGEVAHAQLGLCYARAASQEVSSDCGRYTPYCVSSCAGVAALLAPLPSFTNNISTTQYRVLVLWS